MAEEDIIILTSDDDEADTDDEDPPEPLSSSFPKEVERTELEKHIRLQWGQHNINSGRLRELPMISIDKFHGDALKANIFFLTHLHTDHMVGLEFAPFFRRIDEPGVKLYTCAATPLLFPIFSGSGYLGGPSSVQRLIREEKLVPRDVNVKFELNYKDKRYRRRKKVFVTMIPAGHCPGSVMLLFEFDNERILYTGDFRLSSNEIKNLTSCYYQSKKEYLKDYPDRKSTSANFKSKLKKVSHLYLDTTFCSNKAITGGSSADSSSSLVSRDGAIEQVLPRIKEHLKTKGNIIRLEFSARVSHEYAIVQFHKLLNQKTHVSPEIRDIYAEIDACVESMTLDPKAVIHLCKKTDKCVSGKNVLKIKFSAMWFTMGKGTSTIRERGNFLNVCYSMHASMEEMASLIESFDAQVVTPLVLPRDMPRNQIEDALRNVTKHNFVYKDYGNELTESDVSFSSSQESNSQKSISSTEGHTLTDSQISISPIFNSLELFENEYIMPSKRAKFIDWNRSKSPSPSDKQSCS